MTEHLAHQAALQMPQVTRTDAFGLIALDQLAEDRFDLIADAAQIVAARRIRILAGFAEWGKQAHAIGGQRIRQESGPGVAIPNQVPGGVLGDGRGNFGLGHIGRRQGNPSDDARPRQTDVAAKAIEGLPSPFTMPERGLAFEQSAAPGPGKSADGNREAVDEGDLGIVRDSRDDPSPDLRVDGPQISGVPGEGGAVDTRERRKPRGIVTPKAR